MLLKYFYDDRLAQASYMVGCPANGTAIVIDPSRDIALYLQAAQAEGLTITGVTETHIHADYVSGTRELAAATDAQMYLSALGGADWQYAFPAGKITLLHNGDVLTWGSVKLTVLHTPGHTPEHICFLVTDTARGEQPLGIFTGDCLFVGDVGRPDLLEVAVGVQGSAEIGARQQFTNIQRFKHLPDYLQIFPGHGAGSVCGKSLGAVPSTTLGYEKLFNPAFQFEEEQDFVAWLLSDQPEPPYYFAQMKHVNRMGPALLLDLPQAQHIKDTPEGIVPPDALLIDTRPAAHFMNKHIAGSVNVPISIREFCTYAGWYIDYEQPTFFIAYQNDVMPVLNALLSIGVDNVPAYFTSEALSVATDSLPQVTPQQVAEDHLFILDVRGATEYQERHIAHALHIPMGEVPRRLAELPRNTTIAVHCASGMRSPIVASVLRRYGITNVVDMAGGLDAWVRAGLPIE